MAINKNFVIKNGVQVSTDLIIGDADNNKVGIGTTIPGYDLHVARGRKSRGGIGATDLVVTGVSTVKDLLVGGFSGFSSDISVTGIVSARSFGIGTTEIIDRGMRLSGIASLDAITIATIEEAIRVGPNSFTDLKVTGISTFIGIATFSTGIDIKSGVSTFSAPLRLGFAHTTDHAGVALGATVGFGTSAFFRDDAAIFMGSDSDLKIHHDGSNSRIQDVGTGDLIIQGSADIKLQSASAENYIVANDTGSVEIYYDNSKKLESTSGGLNVTGITTFSDRINVVSGVSTFQDNAKLTFGTQSDLIVYHSGSHSFIQDTTGTGNLYIDSNSLQIRNAAGDETQATFAENGAVSLFYDDYNAFQTTPQGINVSGVTTSNRLNISGVSTFTSVGSNLIPDVDGSRNIGAATSEWGNLFIDGTAHIDTLDVDESAFVTTTLTVGTGLTVHPHGTVAIAGITTIGGNLLAGGDILPDEDGSRDLGSSSKEFQDLFIDGTANIDTLDVDATSNFADDVTLVAAGSSTILFDASAHQVVFQDNIRAKFGTGSDLSVYHNGTHSFIENNTGTLYLRAKEGENSVTAFPDGTVKLAYDDNTKLETTSGGINISGIATISDRLQVTSGISTFYDTTQSTSATTGAVIINGGVGIAKNVNIGGNLTVTGTTTFNGGTITLGDADTDNVVFSADVDSNIIPDDDDSFDLGSSTKEWQDLFLDGTAHIDVLDVDETAFVTTKLTVGTGVTIQNNGGVSIAGITTIGGALGIAGNITISNQAPALVLTDTDNDSDFNIQANGGLLSFNDSTNSATRLQINSVGDVFVGSGVTFQQNGNVAIAGITTVGGALDVNSTSNFGGDVVFDGAAANITFDQSTDDLIFDDNAKAVFGSSSDGLEIYHDSSDSFIIDQGTGRLNIRTNGDSIKLQNTDGGTEAMAVFNSNGSVQLYHNANERITTTDDGTDFGGTGSIRVPNGTTGERNASPAAGDFRYNTTTGKFEGYTDEWGDIGGSGGVEEADTSVSTTSATSCGSFAKASFRSAAIIAQITQGSAYQVGRYLLIHDGTTVTTLEESAVATGSMLGTFEGVINGSNVEFRVTMGSSSSATVTTKIDTVTV